MRLSGDRAEAILRTLVPAWPEDATSHKLRIARIQAPDGALIDEALRLGQEDIRATGITQGPSDGTAKGPWPDGTAQGPWDVLHPIPAPSPRGKC